MTTPLVTRADAGLRAPSAGYQRIAGEALTVHYGGPSPWGGRGVGPHARCASILRAWQAYHMDGHGWIDLAYNGAFCGHGYRYEGRPTWARSAANGTNDGNSRSPAVVYLAGLGDPLTDLAKVAARDEQARFGLPLRWGHRDWYSTECPGDDVWAWRQAGFPPPTHAPGPPSPGPIILPPRPVSVITLAPDPEDDGPMKRHAFDCGVLDGNGAGAVIFDGGATNYPGIAHFEAIPYDRARGVNVIAPFPPIDQHKGGVPHTPWQNRDGWLVVDFEDGAPGRGVGITVDVAG